MPLFPLGVLIHRLESTGESCTGGGGKCSHEADFTHSCPPSRGLLFYFHRSGSSEKGTMVTWSNHTASDSRTPRGSGSQTRKAPRSGEVKGPRGKMSDVTYRARPTYQRRRRKQSPHGLDLFLSTSTVAPTPIHPPSSRPPIPFHYTYATAPLSTT